MTKALVFLALLGGCGLYDDDGKKTKVCDDTPVAGIASIGVIDPSTGQCQYTSSGCSDPCGVCAGGVGFPDWASCTSACSALAESACEATAGCHADFQNNQFWQCVAVPASGPTEGGGCASLDAQTCSEHDDCVSLYSAADAWIGCAVENTNTDPGSCTGQVTCNIASPACPANTVPGISGGCYTGYCIPTSQCPQAQCSTLTTETTCLARTDCTPIYTGTDCTCTPSSCTCATETFAHCESGSDSQ